MRYKYTVPGYSARQEYMNRNYLPLLAVSLSWVGNGCTYIPALIEATLKEHFTIDPTRVSSPSIYLFQAWVDRMIMSSSCGLSPGS